MRNTERMVFFYDFTVSTNKKAATPPPMREVIDVLQTCLNEGRASHSISKDTAVLTIAEIQLDEDEAYAAILVRISDKLAPDVVFSNVAENTSRIVRKREGEGRDYAAHLLISLTEEPDAPNVYLGILEKNIGLHRSHVVRLLQAVLRQQYKLNDTTFQCEDPSGARDRQGNPKLIGFRPMLDISGHPSENFVTELEAGTLKDIVLVRNEQEGALGSRAWLKKEETALRVRPNHGAATPSKIWSYIKGALKEQATTFEKARIKFKTLDGSLEMVEIDTESGNVSHDDRYIKSRRISDINPPMEESSDALVAHFVDLIEEQLVAHRQS